MSEKTSLPENYFNDVYRNNEDPWEFETSEYEKRKYQATIKALPREHYQNAFEIGCSIGILTKMLSEKCSNLLSIDVADAALEKARIRLGSNNKVRLQKMAVPGQFPEEMFDLIVLSEVGYYLVMPDLKKLQKKIQDHLEVKGQLLLVHWTPLVPDYPLTGDQVHNSFMELTGADKPFRHLLQQRTENYRLDLLEKV